MRTPPMILIVEDNPAGLEILQTRLEARDYDIITATDGEAGLAMAKEKQPDLILLDIMMPKMDGIEVCRHIKADPSLPFIPIIMVTAKADSKDVVAGLEAGGDEYLTKPVDQAALVARVKSMLRIKGLHDTVLEQAAQLKAQLETATKVQSLFWPKIPQLNAGSHIWAVSLPATYVGGDLYDVIPLPDNSLLAYVADVCGHGVPAALIMAALSTKIRSEALLQSEIDKLLEATNHTMFNLISEEVLFATIFLARYWPTSGKLQFTVGGHLRPLWIVEDGLGNFPELKGISLGIKEHVHYEKKEILLSPGESVLFFTDGIVEARNENGELFGNDRLVDLMEQANGPPWGKGLLDLINNWRGNTPVRDDLTVLEIWRDKR